jgi:hypothetical protein
VSTKRLCPFQVLQQQHQLAKMITLNQNLGRTDFKWYKNIMSIICLQLKSMHEFGWTKLESIRKRTLHISETASAKFVYLNQIQYRVRYGINDATEQITRKTTHSL